MLVRVQQLVRLFCVRMDKFPSLDTRFDLSPAASIPFIHGAAATKCINDRANAALHSRQIETPTHGYTATYKYTPYANKFALTIEIIGDSAHKTPG